MMKKFTFKTEHPTGQWKSFKKPSHYIKLNGGKVGSISAEEPFIIRFSVIKADINEDGNSNCTWKWITLKKESKSLIEAKEFINNNIAAITAKYNLHIIDY